MNRHRNLGISAVTRRGVSLAGGSAIAGQPALALGLSIAFAAVVAATISSPVSAQPLDYQMFKTRVEPIFLEKRDDHARCYACHSQSNNGFHLERLAPGDSFWTEEQSQKNFAAIANVVNPGDPMASPLLLHPLAPEAGGDAFHSGGRQFASKDDPDWQIFAAFVGGQKPTGMAK
jgi:hypothetical protein